MSKPKFVAISDLHFNEKNLQLCTSALLQSMRKAVDLGVPLVIAGDLHDTKPIIRAEVANRLINILEPRPISLDVYILVGNHDMINEKGTTHGLNYLRPYATVIDTQTSLGIKGVSFIPYKSKSCYFEEAVLAAPDGDIIVCHQGVQGALMGDYVQDNAAVNKEVLKDHIFISGHYHKHQTIGNFTYIGSPFTMSFGEANDGPKGFLIVNEDGSFTREILNLRKHIIADIELPIHEGNIEFSFELKQDNLVWLKLRGSSSELSRITKDQMANIVGHSNFKLDKIPTESDDYIIVTREHPRTDGEILDELIEGLSAESLDTRGRLKSLWKQLLS